MVHAVKFSFLALINTMLAVSMPVLAADDAPGDDRSAQDNRAADMIDPAALISLVQQDWNSDGRLDKALLLRTSPSTRNVALRIYLSDDSAAGYRLAGRHDAIAWAGSGRAGRPDLSASTNGVTLRSGNDNAQDNPWHEVYSIEHRDDRFVVSRYTVTWHDKSDRRAGFRCDLNLLSGSGIRNTSSLESVPVAPALNDWQRSTLPENCRVSPD